MFENLIGQDEVRGLLEGDLRGGSLPQSLLLDGPPGSGKLTAALELARVLSCEAPAPGEWNCPCRACESHRLLVHPDLLLLGRRSFPEELPAAVGLIDRAPLKASAYFLTRAFRKLLKRFDPALWEGEEARLGKAAPLVAEIEEGLALFDPGRIDGEAGEEERRTLFAKPAQALLAAGRKLEALVPDNPPVAMVRSAESWARTSPWGRRKTIIIENADSMHDSARNALLKILEEPPATLCFALVTPRPSSLLRTILSRVRRYHFAERGAAANALVLSRVFRSPEAAIEGTGPANLSVAAWLSSLRNLPPFKARELARLLLGTIVAGRLDAGARHGELVAEEGIAASAERRDIAGSLAAILSETKDFGQREESRGDPFSAILEAMGAVFSSWLRAPTLDAADLAWIGNAAAELRDCAARRATFNLAAPLLLESLAYRLRDLPPAAVDGPR